MHLLALSTLVLLSVAQEPARTPGAVDARTLDTDALIQALPEVGSECRWSEAAHASMCDPAVDELRRRIDSGVTMTDEQWRSALLRSRAIRMRPCWPADRPFAVALRVPAWLGDAAIRCTPTRPGMTTARASDLARERCGTYSLSALQDQLYQELGNLPQGSNRLEFDVRITRGVETKRRYETVVLWSGTLVSNVEVVPTLDEAFPAVTNEELDAQVRASLGVAFSDWAKARTAIVVLDPDTSVNPRLLGTAISLQVEVMEGGEVRDTFSLIASSADPLALGSSLSRASKRSIAFRASEAIPADAEHGSSAGWHLRVRGTTDEVLYDWDAERRWGGSLDLPLDALVRAERERAGPKGRGAWCWMPRRR